MSQQLDRKLAAGIDSTDIIRAIEGATNDGINCDRNVNTVIHHCCLITDEKLKLPKPSCANSFIYLIIKIISTNPAQIDDTIKTAIGNYFHTDPASCEGLIKTQLLDILAQSEKPTLTWLKYEVNLIHLIKEHLYKPKVMANEILSTGKDELSPAVASRLSSVIKSCVDHCRQASTQDEEEKEKWCEIIDWLSWFIVPEEDEPF